MASALTPKRASASTGLSVSLRPRSLRLLGVETGIDQDVAAVAPDQPDEIVEVLRGGLVRIRQQVIHVGGARRHRRIAQGVDFVDVSHRLHFLLLGLADDRSKPPPSAKVKPGAGRRLAGPSLTASRRARLTPRVGSDTEPRSLRLSPPPQEGGDAESLPPGAAGTRRFARCPTAKPLHGLFPASSRLVAVNCR